MYMKNDEKFLMKAKIKEEGDKYVKVQKYIGSL